jgi:hypothetical protein
MTIASVSLCEICRHIPRFSLSTEGARQPIGWLDIFRGDRVVARRRESLSLREIAAKLTASQGAVQNCLRAADQACLESKEERDGDRRIVVPQHHLRRSEANARLPAP